MDIRTLQVFVGLSRNLHFGRTSAQFHLSPSALSRAIARLEANVGYPLLQRDRRSVEMTTQGEIFLKFALDVISRWDRLQTDLGVSRQRLSGKLTLFASVTASQSILPSVLQRFRRAHPGIQIQLETGYAVNALQRLRDGCDVVVAALPEVPDPDLVRRIIMDIPILTVAPVDPAAITGLSAKPVDWSQVPLILPTAGQARDNIEAWLRRNRIRPKIYSEVAGNEAVVALVALGCGVGFVPELVLRNSPLADEVRVLSSGPALSDFHVGFCTRSRHLAGSPLVQAFWEAIPPAVAEGS